MNKAAARELEIFMLRSRGPVLTVPDAVDQAFPALSYRVSLAALHRVRETPRNPIVLALPTDSLGLAVTKASKTG